MSETPPIEKRGRGRPKGCPGGPGRPPGIPGIKNPRDAYKRKIFDHAINRYAGRKLQELRDLLANIEDKSAMEIMAIRTLLHAAEDGSKRAIERVLSGTRAKEAIGKINNSPPVDDLPDPSEFAAGEVE